MKQTLYGVWVASVDGEEWIFGPGNIAVPDDRYCTTDINDAHAYADEVQRTNDVPSCFYAVREREI